MFFISDYITVCRINHQLYWYYQLYEYLNLLWATYQYVDMYTCEVFYDHFFKIKIY